MRIVQYGNLRNNGYKTAKYLRQIGIESDLVIAQSDLRSEVNHPAWEDEELAEGLPSWVHVSRRTRMLSPVGRAEELWRLRHYDLIHARCETAMAVQGLGVPFVAQSLGSDLSEVAFERSWRGALLRRAYRRAQCVLYNNIHQGDNVSRLGLTNAIFSPNPLDTERYSPGPVDLGLSGRGLVFFAPARQDWTDSDPDRRSMKGNDRLVRAFAAFIESGHRGVLILLEHGVDVQATKALVADLGLHEHVVYLAQLKKRDLVKYLRGSDVVIDQFTMGCFGGTALEAMACAKPLVIYINGSWAARHYPTAPPILNAQTTDQILQWFLEMEDPRRREEIGTAVREWILKYHRSDRVSASLAKLYEAVLAGESADMLPALV